MINSPHYKSALYHLCDFALTLTGLPQVFRLVSLPKNVLISCRNHDIFATNMQFSQRDHPKVRSTYKFLAVLKKHDKCTSNAKPFNYSILNLTGLTQFGAFVCSNFKELVISPSLRISR